MFCHHLVCLFWLCLHYFVEQPWGMLQFPSLNYQLSTTTSSLCLLFNSFVVGTVRGVVFLSIFFRYCNFSQLLSSSLVSSFHLLITSYFAVAVRNSSSLEFLFTGIPLHWNSSSLEFLFLYWLRLCSFICTVCCMLIISINTKTLQFNKYGKGLPVKASKQQKSFWGWHSICERLQLPLQDELSWSSVGYSLL